MPRGVQVNWLSGKKGSKQASKEDRKLCFATCAHFYGVNPSTGANLKLPTWLHWHGVGKRWRSPRSWRGHQHRAQSLTARFQKGWLCVPLFYELLQMKGGWERRTGLTAGLPRTESTLGCPEQGFLPSPQAGLPLAEAVPRGSHVRPIKEHCWGSEGLGSQAAAQILPLQFTRFEDLGILSMSLSFCL